MNRYSPKKQQRGVVTLFTALILLICITLVTLLTAKTVLVETQIAADNYRITQAVAAANAALDYGIAYFDDGGFDHNGDGAVDVIANQTYTSKDGTLTTTASITFNNTVGTRCVPTGTANMKSGLITATGFSDDGQAQRTVSQCVGTVDIFGGNSPKQPLVARGGVGLSGNYSIINRFNNTTVWSGNSMSTSGSAQTYLRPNNSVESAFTKDQLQDYATNNNYTSPPITEWSNSASNKGLGVDVIAEDPRLGTLTGDAFFNNFFYGDRSTMYELAKANNQVYSSFPADTATKGVVWVGPAPCGHPDAASPCPSLTTFSQNGGTYGTRDTNNTKGSPVIMIINGNFDPGGNIEVNGMVYVTGSLNCQGGGNFRTYGSIVVEDPAGAFGNGGVELIYTPYTLDKSANPIDGTTTVISGSWRDW